MIPLQTDTMTIQTIKENILNNLESIYLPEIKMIHWASTFLDPSFKKLRFLSTNTERREMHVKILSFLEEDNSF